MEVILCAMVLLCNYACEKTVASASAWIWQRGITIKNPNTIYLFFLKSRMFLR